MTDLHLCLTAIVAVMLLADLAMTAALYHKLVRPSEEERNEAAVEEAMRQEAAKADPMDEGFENIMRFSVNGKTGFELDFSGKE